MKKFGIFLLTLLLAVLIAGLYGILHDQVTYTISHEYFTKFKFIQFDQASEGMALRMPEPRKSVAVVGFLATWWTGIFIGIGLGLAGLSFREPRMMFRYILRAIGLVLAVTLAAGVTGGLYGRFYLFKTGVDWWLPDNLVNKRDFITVGSIHNFSYLGGLLGLLIGIFYLVSKNRKRKKI